MALKLGEARAAIGEYEALLRAAPPPSAAHRDLIEQAPPAPAPQPYPLPLPLPPPLPPPRLLLLTRLGPGVHLGRHVLHGRGLGTRARPAHLQPVVAVLLPTEGLQYLARERERLRVSGQGV